MPPSNDRALSAALLGRGAAPDHLFAISMVAAQVSLVLQAVKPPNCLGEAAAGAMEGHPVGHRRLA